MYQGEIKSWITLNGEEKIFDVYLVSEVGGFAKGFMQPSITCAMIEEVIYLPNKDVLIGFKCMIQKGVTPKETIYYYKLSEIRLIDQTTYYVRMAEETKQKLAEINKETQEKIAQENVKAQENVEGKERTE